MQILFDEVPCNVDAGTIGEAIASARDLARDRGRFIVDVTVDGCRLTEADLASSRRHAEAARIIRFTSAKGQKDCPDLLRRVVVWDAENEREIVLLTNHLDFGATTLSAIYRERWKIELFFKAVKQNLKIKSFIGTSENALRIQIWTALIVMLLLRWLHYLSKATWSFSNLASMLRLNLFTYRDLTDWLHDPFETPPVAPHPYPEQILLDLQGLGQPKF